MKKIIFFLGLFLISIIGYSQNTGSLPYKGVMLKKTTTTSTDSCAVFDYSTLKWVFIKCTTLTSAKQDTGVCIKKTGDTGISGDIQFNNGKKLKWASGSYLIDQSGDIELSATGTVYLTGAGVYIDPPATFNNNVTFNGNLNSVTPTVLNYIANLTNDAQAQLNAKGTGSVTSVSVASANGFSGTVANATTTPAITIIAGAITPSSVNSVVISGSSTPTLAVTGTSTISGTNTGDQTNITGNAATVTTNANLTGPITSVGNATSVASQTGTGNTFVMNTSPTLVTPNIGTPSAGVATNLTGTAAGLTAGNVTTNANLTGAVTSSGNATSLGSFSSANLSGALTDETGSGSAVFATSPTLVTPALGTPSALVGTNITGTAAGLTAGNVTTNANLTGVVTSVGNATSYPTQAANTTHHGPVSGSAAASTFRTTDRRDLNNIYTEIGTIFTENWANLTQWTTVGTPTPAVASGKLSFSGTAGVSNYIRCSGYGFFNYERAKFVDTVIVGTIGAGVTTPGIAIGVQSTAANINTSFFVNVVLTTTNLGKIIWYTNGVAGSASTEVIGVTAGDTLIRTLSFEKNRYVFLVRNKTTGFQLSDASVMDLGYSATSTTDFPYANAGNFAYYYLGGSTHKVMGFSVASKHLKYPKVLIVGDSRERATVNDANARVVDRLNKEYYGIFEIHAQSGNSAQDFKIADITAYQAEIIILTVGVNNINTESAGTAFTNYQTLVNNLVAQGYVLGSTLYLGLIEAGSIASVFTFNTSMQTTFGKGNCIDFFTQSWSGGAATMNAAYTIDGTHSNSYVSSVKTEIIANKLNLVKRENAISGSTYILKNRNGFSSFGIYDFSPLAAIHALNDNGASQIMIGGSKANPDRGGSLLSSTASELYVSGGAYHNGTNFISGATTFSGIDFKTGEFNFFAKTGASVGSSLTPIQVAKMDVNGKLFLCGSTSPTARLHIAAGAAAVSSAPQKFTIGPVLTTAEKGAVEYGLNGRFFFTPLTVRKSFVLSDTVVVTDGMLPIGNTSTGLFNSAVITPGINLLVTNGAGAITLNADTTAGATKLATQGDITRATAAAILSGSGTLDFPSTLAGTVSELTITVTGAADGDPCDVGVPNASMPATGTYEAYVSSSNTVTVRYANNSLTLTQDPASGTFKVKVFK